MVRETESGQKSYLQRSLAEGAKPFRFRGRVRSLLGRPHSDGVEVNFSNPLSIPGFTYVVPRSTGQFERPDELFTGGPRRATHAEEITPSIGCSAVTSGEPDRASEQRAPYGRSAGRPEELNQLLTKKPAMHRVEFQPLTPFGAPRPSSVGEISDEEHALPQSRPKSTQMQDGTERNNPACSTHEETVPELRRDAVPERGSHTVEHAEQSPPHAPTFLTAPAASPPDLGVRKATTVYGPGVAGAPPATNDSLSSEVRSTAQLRTESESALGQREPAEPQVRKGLQLSPSRARDRSESLVAKSLPHHCGEDSVPLTGSFPSLRRPAPPSPYADRRSSQTRQQSSPDATSSQAPAVPAMQPPVVIVKQSSDSGTPVAFWERRYLNHWRVRIRR